MSRMPPLGDDRPRDACTEWLGGSLDNSLQGSVPEMRHGGSMAGTTPYANGPYDFSIAAMQAAAVSRE